MLKDSWRPRLVIVPVLGCAASLFANDYYWTGQTSGQWSNSGNWYTASPGTVDAHFGGWSATPGTFQVTNNSAGLSIGSIAFDNTTGGSFQLSGNAITLTTSASTITQNSSFAQTISNNIRDIQGVTLGGNGSGAVTLAGNIDPGSQLVVKQGTSTYILTGNNSYSTWTAVTAGTLQVGNGSTSGTLGNKGVNINSGATLTFNRSDDIAFSHAITGYGQLNKDGSNTLTLDGNASSYGATNINAGALQVTGRGSLGNGAVTIARNAQLTVANPAPTELAMAITGQGGLTKSAAGALTLSGTKTYTGETHVDAGTLTLAGGLQTSKLTVAGGALLDGSGAVAGSLKLVGTVSPGDSAIRSLSFGSAEFTPGSKFVVTLTTPSSSGPTQLAADQLLISGNATGTLDIDVSQYQFGKIGGTRPYTYDIGQVSGSHSLRFSLTQTTVSPSHFSVGWGGAQNDQIMLTYHAVPEATTVLLGLIGAMPLVLHRRRRRSAVRQRHA